MSIPINKSYFFSTSSYPGTTYGALTEVSPPNTNTTWGWVVGQNTPPNYCEMNQSVEVTRTNVQWLAAPTQSVPNQNAGGLGHGNGWILGPIDGEFVPGNWQITMSVKSTTAANGQDGRFIYRVWTCASGSGAGPTLVTSSFISSSTVTNLTTTPVALTTNIRLPQINLHSGYVFLQTYWMITGAATNNQADVDNVFGSAAGKILSSPFVTSRSQIVSWLQNDKA